MTSELVDPRKAPSVPGEGVQQGDRIKSLGAIVMAAGIGQRMRSKLVKVLHRVAGRPMLLYPLDLATRLAGDGVTIVVGRQGDAVKALVQAHHAETAGTGGMRGISTRAKGLTASVRHRGNNVPPIVIAPQGEPLGTGHAVLRARAAILRTRGGAAARYLILNGDTPLLTEGTVRELLRLHERTGATVTVLTAVLDDPVGYGRVVREEGGAGADGRVLRIVEDRDATEAEHRLREVNVGTYVVEGAFLFEALDWLEAKNAQGEYYLTDLVALAGAHGLRVSALPARDAEEGLGINTRQQLALAERILRQRICARWLDAGVTILDPATTLIDADVMIGQDTVLYPGVALEGRTIVGEDCEVRSHVRITDSRLGRGVVVQDCCVIREGRLEDDTMVGPFAHLRPGTVVRRKAKVGNFVELKKTDLGEGAKANHLSYLGDAKIGKDVNIGAGTITCNYDGVCKHMTVIEDGVFIGSDTQFIAPVAVGRGAVIAAGATITTDVPADALAIARTPQVNRPGWAARHRAITAGASVGGRQPAIEKPKARDAGREVKSRSAHPKPAAGKHLRAKKARRR